MVIVYLLFNDFVKKKFCKDRLRFWILYDFISTKSFVVFSIT